MNSNFIRLALLCGFSLLLVHSAIAQIIPAPATPPPIIDPGTIIGPTPNPTMPPITPPPVPTVPPTPPVATPTIPPVSPPPVATPTIPPVSPPPVATPTVPPITPPPVVTPTVPPAPTIPPAPTVPPISSPPPISVPPVLEQADPQRTTAIIRYGPGYALALTPQNSQGRFQKIALQPAQTITVLVRFSPADIGKPANLQILDGGAVGGIEVPEAGFPDIPGMPVFPDIPIEEIIGPVIDPNTVIDTGQTLPVSPAGQLAFGFRIGADVGLHRVSIIVGGNQYFFQFWRQDPSALNNNPGMLRAY